MREDHQLYIDPLEYSARICLSPQNLASLIPILSHLNFELFLDLGEPLSHHTLDPLSLLGSLTSLAVMMAPLPSLLVLFLTLLQLFVEIHLCLSFGYLRHLY